MSGDPPEDDAGAGEPMPFAHSLPGKPEDQWELLFPHARAVGDRAAGFAARFGAGEAARFAGYLHDIGKVSAAFQAYIRLDGPKCSHSTAGARIADGYFTDELSQWLGRLIALAIAGHHGGLPNGADLARRLSSDIPDFAGWEQAVPPLPDTIVPHLAGRSGASNGYFFAFLGRMLFSCLVDADFLETERFYAEAEGNTPVRGGHASLEELRERLNRKLASFANSTGEINQHRAHILETVRAKAVLAPGLFTMTVPTGGGKTLAGLAFALDHAIEHKLDRVVFVIPYTSIIEQTAAVFRDALGNEGEVPDVLEHTGTMDWDALEREQDDKGARDAVAKLRRAAENWDVPVVVTTAVQFFESLHADRPSRCRKLHNLAKSVIVLDEAQTLPIPLLRPCMAAIDELAASYGASVVLCTATQPALTQQQGFDAAKGGLDVPPDRELAPEPKKMYEQFRRVRVRHAGAVSDAALADRFADTDRMLCIVNSRAHAQTLFAAIEHLPGARHLTTLMCPAHRRQVLGGIRAALRDRQHVRLVATSLIEAGVDVDFPEVWRAENGLDSVAQAAGRCNREGSLAEGATWIFATADHKLPAMFGQQVGAMKAALDRHPDDPLGLDAIRSYFRTLYWTKGDAQLDAAKLDGAPYPIISRLAASHGFGPPTPPYADVARAFRFIEEAGKPVIVPWRGGEEPDEVARLAEALIHAPVPPGSVLRRLQQFTVTVPERSYATMLATGAIQPIDAGRYADRFMLLAAGMDLYSERTGLRLDPLAEPWMGAF